VIGVLGGLSELEVLPDAGFATFQSLPGGGDGEGWEVGAVGDFRPVGGPLGASVWAV